jgi:hypothetical protein
METRISRSYLQKDLIRFAESVIEGSYQCYLCLKPWRQHARTMRCYDDPGSAFFHVRPVFLSWPMDEVRSAIEKVYHNMHTFNKYTVRDIFCWQACKNCNTYWQEHDHSTGRCLFVPNCVYELPALLKPAGLTKEQVIAALQAFK